MDPRDFTSPTAGKTIRARTGYWAFLPNPLPPEIDWSLPLISALAETERALSRMAALIGEFPFPRLLIQPFMRSEAVISSRIEGTHASLVDVYTYEAAQLSFFKSIDDVREVHNYVCAMRYGLERLQSLPVSMRFIRELHAKLMENVRGGTLTPGEFRRTQNWIGPVGSTLSSAAYVPPPVEEMHQALGALEKFIHAHSEIPPLIRIGLIHYQFEAIHPFLDGNGRVGRLLIVLLLCEWGLLPQPLLNLSAYIEQHRKEYYDLLLAVSQKGSWESWLVFFLRGIQEQAQDGVIRMQQLQSLRMQYQSIADNDRNPARMALVLDFLFARPIFSINQVAENLDISFKTARDYIDKLMQIGVLREITGHTRNRIFQANEILKALQSLEKV
ncbi:MAG: Fic family protein [Anaerolineaceae bacterium]|jgi:Fic family protein|nr:MAG: Fic family protein [Anaerolineaceae bacterium]